AVGPRGKADALAQPAVRAVGVDDAVLLLDRRAGAQALQPLDPAGPVLGVDDLLPARQVALEELRRAAGQRLDDGGDEAVGPRPAGGRLGAPPAGGAG